MDKFSIDNRGNLYLKTVAVLADSSTTATAEAFSMTDTESMMFEFDGFNRMAGMETGGTVAEYEYNSDGIRISKTVNDERTDFVLEDGYIIAEIGFDNDVTNYVRGLTGIIYRKTSDGAKTYYVTNNHGDVTKLVNSSGAVIQTYTYDEYGNVTSSTGTDTNPFKYCGEYYDEESGLIYLRARYYSPELGRFISEDPIRDDLNWYAYCGSNPVNAWDPSGKISEEEVEMYKNGEMAPMSYSYLMYLTYQWWLADAQEEKDYYHNLAEEFRANDYKTTNGLFPGVDEGIAYMDRRPDGWGIIPLSVNEHYFRNKLNLNFSYNELQILQERLPEEWKWDSNVLANEHQNNTIDGKPNIKFVSACGSFELIFNGNNELQTQYNNWEDMGTFNYYSPIDEKVQHAYYDWLPYKEFGNVPYSERR